MSLRFVLGDLSLDRKEVTIEAIYQLKQARPQAKFFYLVPDHLKFDMESRLLAQVQRMTGQSEAGMMDIQVTSFSRLAWFIRPESLVQQAQVSTIGLTMLVRQILHQLSDQLRLFRGQINHQGFTEKLVQLFDELYQGNIRPEDLDWVLQQNDTFADDLGDQASTQQLRIEELTLIYSAFVSRLEAKGLSNYQLMSQLTDDLSQGQYPDHYIIIDHYYYFNAQEQALLLTLMEVFQAVWVSLPIPPEDLYRQAWNPLTEPLMKTYQQLHQLAQQAQIDVESPLVAKQCHQGQSQDLLQLAHLFRADLTQRPLMVRDLAGRLRPDQFHLWQHDSLQTELRQVSNEIFYLVTQLGYRYQDILVVARDLDRYQPLVGPYFKLNQIPVFFDHRQRMDQSLLATWLRSAFNLLRYYYRYEDMVTLIRNDLSRPDSIHRQTDAEVEFDEEEYRHQLDLLENVILAYGFTGYRFFELDYAWIYDETELTYYDVRGQATGETVGEVIDRLRIALVEDLLQPLARGLALQSGAQLAEWLYQIVDSCGIRQRMIQLRDQAIESGDLAGSRQLEQTWEVFMQTLSEFHELYQDQPIEFGHFCDLILAGLDQATYHIIPPSLDQVTFTNMESPQVGPYKVCFVLGSDDQQLPKSWQMKSLLSTQEREWLNQQLLPHQYLTVSFEQMNQLEPILMYQLLLQATDRLYFSYAAQDQDQDQTLTPSPYLRSLARLLEIKFKHFSYHQTLDQGTAPQQLLASYPAMQAQLVRELQVQQQGGYLLTPSQLDLWQVLDRASRPEESDTSSRLEGLLRAIFTHQRLPQNLSAETALALYGRDLFASVSKIERYYQDPYSHFLIYGLKLQERPRYQLDYAQAGDYLHDAMDRFIQGVQAMDLDLSQLTDEALDPLIKDLLTRLSEDRRYQILTSQPQLELVKASMDYQLYRFIHFSHHQARQLSLHPIRTEAIFGLGRDTLKGLSYDLQSGGQLRLTGKIDRIDQVSGEGNDFLQVIDYKSGTKTFELKDVFYGRDLQILTYLQVALLNYQRLAPLGAFYQPMILSFENMRDPIPDALIDQQLQQHRLQGFVTVSAEELQSLEPRSQELGQSLVYPAVFTSKGDFRKDWSTYYSLDQLETLMSYINHLYRVAANRIQAGHIELAPYEDDSYTPSLSKAFRVISGFDATEHYHLYRHRHVNNKQAMSQIDQFMKGMKANDT